MCDMFKRLLEDHASEPALRELIETPHGFDMVLWRKMAELGLAGVLIPAEEGGTGGSLAEVEALMEVAGGFLLNGPFIDSCVIAPSLLLACQERSKFAEHLRNIVSGEAIYTVAGCGQSGDWMLPPEVEARRENEEWLLTGSAHFVSYAHVADHAIVAATCAGEFGIFLLPIDDAGVEITLHESNDPTQRLSSLRFEGARAQQLVGVDSNVWRAAVNNGLVAFAGEHVGAARSIFDITIDYLQTRHQFGQPIGKFQALKHMAADLCIELESATSAARYAARARAAGEEEGDQLSYLAALPAPIVFVASVLTRFSCMAALLTRLNIQLTCIGGERKQHSGCIALPTNCGICTCPKWSPVYEY